jgi:hypothetical protein
MAIEQFHVPLWIELLAAGLGGLRAPCSRQVSATAASTYWVSS